MKLNLSVLLILAGIFMMPIVAAAQSNDVSSVIFPLNGTIKLSQSDRKSAFRARVDNFELARIKPSVRKFPDVSFDVVTDGYDLIPTVLSPIRGEHEHWEFVPGAGHIWQEGTKGRVAMPFALVQKNANCVHNGLLTFEVSLLKT